MWVGKPMPHAAHAVVPEGKLERYILDDSHDLGRHKARVFASVLGIHVADAEFLKAQILAEVRYAEVTVSSDGWDGGRRFEVPVTIRGRNGHEHRVMSAWFLPDGGDEPRLVTAYVDV